MGILPGIPARSPRRAGSTRRGPRKRGKREPPASGQTRPKLAEAISRFPWLAVCGEGMLLFTAEDGRTEHVLMEVVGEPAAEAGKEAPDGEAAGTSQQRSPAEGAD